MQNVQKLLGVGGCSKYVCKYINKMDEQNYVVVKIDGRSKLVTLAVFLHNTKVLSSKIAEDKERQKDDNRVQGRCICHMEMLHMQLGYPEVVTNHSFVNIATTPLKLCAGVSLKLGIFEG